MKGWATVIWAVVLLGLGCSGSDDEFDSQSCTYLEFDEVTPATSDAAFRAEIEAALAALCVSDSDRDLGYHTYRSIATGLVQLDVLEDLSDADYQTVLVFMELPSDTPREQAMPAILRDMVGYMWGNRLYFQLGLTTGELAATLVHEVNHVLNRSDENYYLPIDGAVSEAERKQILNELRTDHGAAFREEYRAFYVEEVYNGAPLDVGMRQSMRTLKQDVASLYELSIDIDAFPDFPEGVLVPDPEGWSQRPPSLCASDLVYFPCEE